MRIEPKPRVEGKGVKVEQAGNEPHRFSCQASPLQGNLNHRPGHPAPDALRFGGHNPEGKVRFPLVNKTDPPQCTVPAVRTKGLPGIQRLVNRGKKQKGLRRRPEPCPLPEPRLIPNHQRAVNEAGNLLVPARGQREYVH